MTQELDRNQCIHGRPQNFFQGWQRRNFAYRFQVADDHRWRNRGLHGPGPPTFISGEPVPTLFNFEFCLVGSAVARVSEAPPEISRGAPHKLLAYYYELQ